MNPTRTTDPNRRLCLQTVFVIALLVGAARSARAARPRPLGAQARTRVERFLFPLPQDCRIGDSAFRFSPSACSLQAGPELSEQERLYVADFRAHWKQEFGTDLSATRRDGAGLTIIVGRNGASPGLAAAAKARLLDAAYLAGRPNREQAYALTCAATGDGVTVWLAANDAPGLYYALGTFEQLLSALRTASAVVVPEVQIVDWPDIAHRGIWGTGASPSVAQKNQDAWRHYAALKLDTYWGPHLYMRVSADKKISYAKSKKSFEPALRHNVRSIPTLVHLDYMLGAEYGVGKHFPEVAGKDKDGKRINTWCWSNPRSGALLEEMFEAIARGVGNDRLWVWPSEHPKRCYCGNCAQTLREQFTTEIKHIMRAYAKAKRIKPALKMDIITSQATYPHNLALLAHIPKEVGIDIYAGSGPGNTYKTTFGEYLLTPSVREMRRRGYRVGVVPLLAPAGAGTRGFFPFNTPLLAKLRMSEFKDYGMERMILWLPNAPVWQLNLQAAAEYAWNTTGRTPEEFAAAWATRAGLASPERAAQFVCMLEYPQRALSSGMRADQMLRPVERMVSTLLSKKPEWGPHFSMPAGFEYGTNEELARTLQLCDQAVTLAQQIGYEEFVAGAKLTRQWIAVFERYTFFLENRKKDPAAAVRAGTVVAQLAPGLHALSNAWLAMQPMDEKKKQGTARNLKRLMKEFERLSAATKE